MTNSPAGQDPRFFYKRKNNMINRDKYQINSKLQIRNVTNNEINEYESRNTSTCFDIRISF